MFGILDALGVQRAHVVGHDWGAALAWAMAAFVPDRVDHLVALSVGHPSAFRDAGFAQREKSWYMLLFQFEDIAETWLSADDFANMRAWAQHPDIDQVVDRPRSPRRTDRGAQLVSGERASTRVDRTAAGVPADSVTDDGDLELRRLRPRGVRHDVVESLRRRAVALRAHRRAGTLDAARSPRQGLRTARRLPADSVTAVTPIWSADSLSYSALVTGHAPSDLLEITVYVSLRFRVMPAAKRHAGVVALQPDGLTGAGEPEPEAVPLLLRHDAARPHHFGNPFFGDDLATEDGQPQSPHVGHGRIDASVAIAAHRQMEDVAAHHAIDLEVSERGTSGEFVGPQKRCVDHPCGLAHALVHEVVKRHTADTLGDQGEHDEPTVAVRKVFTRLELGGMAVEGDEILLGVGQLVYRNRHHVVTDVGVGVLVEIVTDT